MPILQDMYDGHGGRVTQNGWEIDRIAVVTGVTGTGHAKLYNAVNTAGLPDIGDPHPTITTARVVGITPVPVDVDKVKITYHYSEAFQNRQFGVQLDTVQVAGQLSQVETNKDINGTVISVEYAYPATYPYNDNLQGVTSATSKLITRLIPEHSIVISKLEYANPSAKAKGYVGKVNFGAWSLDTGAAARQWLCTGIAGRSDDGGASYSVTYSFQYREDGWDQTVVFIDPNTGAPPDDLIADTGIKTPYIYETANFNNLGL